MLIILTPINKYSYYFRVGQCDSWLLAVLGEKMQFYKDGFRGGSPDIKQAAPNRRNRGTNEPFPEKVDVLISGTGTAGLCLVAQLA